MSQIKASELISFNTYKKCKQFTILDLLNELKLRNWLAKSNFEDLVYHPQIETLLWTKDHFKQFWFDKIISGQPFAHAYGDDFYRAHLPFVETTQKKQIINLVDSPALSIFTSRDIVESATRIEKINKRFEGSKLPEKMRNTLKEGLLDAPHRTSRSHLTVAVDLSYPDALLKKTFEKALSSWKSELRLKKNNARSSRVTKLYNLLDYNAFFIQDYLFLCNYLQQKKSLNTLCKMIKGDDRKYENFIEVEYKFAIKAIDSEDIELLEQKIKSNQDLKTRPIMDITHLWQ
jgi:hypothetical protein